MNLKKRKFDFLDKSNKITKKIKSKKSKNDEDDDDSNDDESTPSILPNLFSKEESKIYLKSNHLYFRTDVSEDSVDELKKYMRQYWTKINAIDKTHECIEFKPKPLYLHIFSPGGCAYSGFSLYDFILEYRKKIPVYTVVEGLVASAATFISIAGTKRFMSPNSYMLIHQLSTFMGGNFEQIQDEFNNSKKCMEKIIQIYKTHTKIDKKKIPDILKHDINWDAAECLTNGLIDEIKLFDIFNDDEN